MGWPGSKWPWHVVSAQGHSGWKIWVWSRDLMACYPNHCMIVWDHLPVGVFTSHIKESEPSRRFCNGKRRFDFDAIPFHWWCFIFCNPGERNILSSCCALLLNVSLRSLIPKSQECESGIRSKTNPWATSGLWFTGNQTQAYLCCISSWFVEEKIREVLNVHLSVYSLTKPFSSVCTFRIWYVCAFPAYSPWLLLSGTDSSNSSTAAIIF